MLLSKSKLQAVALACDEPSRPQLNGIYVGADGTVVATDGHIMVRVSGGRIDPADFPQHTAMEPYPNPVPKEGVILSTAQVKAALKSWPKKTYLGPLNNARIGINGDSAVLLTTDLDTTTPTAAKLLEGPYPNFDQIMRKDEGKFVTAFNPKLMRTAMDVFIKMGVDGGARHNVKFEFFDSLSACKMTARNDSDEDITMILMPTRLDKVMR